jgi:hypothetical protein
MPTRRRSWRQTRSSWWRQLDDPPSTVARGISLLTIVDAGDGLEVAKHVWAEE